MDERNDQYYNQEFIKIVMDSGYTTGNRDFVREMLENLYEYMSNKTDVPKHQLSAYVTEVTKLLGVEQVKTLDVDDMCDWIVWFRSQGFDIERDDEEEEY
jgi:hypothetical protein